MATLKKYDLTGAVLGEVSLSDELLQESANLQMIKDYLVAINRNQRQWSANTKSRSEVNHSKKKPYQQKGTGNARQGFLGAPQFRGGGRVHTPKPKFDQHVRINRKEKQLAIRYLFSERIKEDQICLLEFKPLKEPKTKAFADFFKALEMDGRRVLLLVENSPAAKEQFDTLQLSIRNIPKTECMYLPYVSGQDLARSQKIVIIGSAFKQLEETLKGS